MLRSSTQLTIDTIDSEKTAAFNQFIFMYAKASQKERVKIINDKVCKEKLRAIVRAKQDDKKNEELAPKILELIIDDKNAEIVSLLNNCNQVKEVEKKLHAAKQAEKKENENSPNNSSILVGILVGVGIAIGIAVAAYFLWPVIVGSIVVTGIASLFGATAIAELITGIALTSVLGVGLAIGGGFGAEKIVSALSSPKADTANEAKNTPVINSGVSVAKATGANSNNIAPRKVEVPQQSELHASASETKATMVPQAHPIAATGKRF